MAAAEEVKSREVLLVLYYLFIFKFLLFSFCIFKLKLLQHVCMLIGKDQERVKHDSGKRGVIAGAKF